jgi:transcription termination/antitermination protein NusG
MSTAMDDPQADAGEQETPDMVGGHAAPPAETPVDDAPPAAEESVAGDEAAAPEEVVQPAPKQPRSRHQAFHEDDEVYVPPVKPETMGKTDASHTRPSLPAHMNEDDTPRDPETIPLQWYVLKVQSNREKSIRDNLIRRIKRDGYSDYFGEIVIPTEKVVETKGGKRKIREQKLFPGYMMIQVRLTDETWFLVRDTSGVGDFTGAAGRPLPMQEHEIQRMLGAQAAVGEEEKPHRPVVKFNISVGDVVKVKEGAFEAFEGAIDSMDETTGKVKVIIEIFGRPTEVELEHWQVEKA